MPQRGRLADKVAIVTGGAQGIGAAIVERFLAEAATVALLDRDADLGAATAKRLSDETLVGNGEAAPGRDPGPLFVHCDVTVGEQVQDAVDEVLGRSGRVDILVNNAGVAAYFDAATMSERDWDSVFVVDLKAVWLCSRSVLPAMRSAGAGSIVNISSIHAKMTSAGSFPYAAAKAGVSGLTRSLALDEGPRGIRVNAVCPGYTRTQLVQEYIDRQSDPAGTEQAILAVHPLGRIATPAEIAAVVAFVASDEASFMTGSEIFVDGGLSARFAT